MAGHRWHSATATYVLRCRVGGDVLIRRRRRRERTNTIFACSDAEPCAVHGRRGQQCLGHADWWKRDHNDCWQRQNSTDSNSSTIAGNLTPSSSLSSGQIIDILQQNPDLVLELKSQVADRMQEQGMQIDANDISDEMLYDQIAGNAGLRANITSYMRARGYVSDDDLQTATSGVGAGDGTGAAQRALTQTGATNTSRSPSDSGQNPGLDNGQSRPEASGLPGTTTRSTSSAGDRQNPAEKRDPKT